jgi:hypothetical protein
MNRKSIALMMFAMASICSADSPAAVISVQPVVAGYFTSDYYPIPPIPPRHNPGVPIVIQIDVYLEVLSLEPGEDSFGSVEFSFLPSPPWLYSGIVADVAGWGGAFHPNVDSNGSTPGGNVPVFVFNGDLTGNMWDLKNIQVRMATGAFTNPVDPRRNIGEPGSSLEVPFLLGSGFMRWDGTGKANVRLSPVIATVKLTDGTFVPAQVLSTNIVRLGGPTPEPSSLVMFGGMLAVAGLRRRT